MKALQAVRDRPKTEVQKARRWRRPPSLGGGHCPNGKDETSFQTSAAVSSPKFLENLKHHWASNETGFTLAGTTPEKIAALESHYKLTLPDDFRLYLESYCPGDGINCDHRFIYWWEFDRIKNISDEYRFTIKNPLVAAEASRYMFFADYIDWCWAWALNCGDGEHRGKVVVIGLNDDEFVADSFKAFVGAYVKQPERLHIF